MGVEAAPAKARYEEAASKPHAQTLAKSLSLGTHSEGVEPTPGEVKNACSLRETVKVAIRTLRDETQERAV